MSIGLASWRIGANAANQPSALNLSQRLVFDHRHLVGTVGGQFVCERRDIVSRQQNVHAGGQTVGYVTRLFDTFERRYCQFSGMSGFGHHNDGFRHQTALPAFSPSMMAA